VLDHVERWRVLEQPSRKGADPFRRRGGRRAAGDEHLQESSGFGRDFPWRGPLARRQPDDDIADPARFAGLHLDVLSKIVALVQQADGRHPLLAGGAEAGVDHCGRFEPRQVLGHFRFRRALLTRLARAGRKRRQQRQRKDCRRGGPCPAHYQASGVQAS